MSKNNSIFFVLLFFLFSCGTSSTSSVSASFSYETTTVQISTSGQTVSVVAELADSAEKRSQGLMGRTSLDAQAGMLFIFDEVDNHSFWMKDTPISLDIIFINDSKAVVYIEQNTIPLSENSIVSNEDVLYVLEVNAGFSSANGINVGDQVSF